MIVIPFAVLLGFLRSRYQATHPHRQDTEQFEFALVALEVVLHPVLRMPTDYYMVVVAAERWLLRRLRYLQYPSYALGDSLRLDV